MKNLPTWFRIGDDWHAVAGVQFDRIIFAMCGRQFPDTETMQIGPHDKNDRCWSCQHRAIEQMRVGVGLDELGRTLLWESEMVDS